METHPEEFYQDKKSGVKFNWSHQIKDNKKFMTEDEFKAVWGKYSEINLERAMREVTERLLAPEPDEVELHGFGNAPVRAEGQSVAYAMQQYRTAEIKAQMEHQKQLLQQHITLHTQLAEGF
jgi:hypothetical protein